VFEVMGLVKKSGLRGDLFVTELREKSVIYEAGRLKEYSVQEETGYGLRVIRPDGRVGFYASNRTMEPQVFLNGALEVSEFGDPVFFDIPSYPAFLEWKDFVDSKIEAMDIHEMVEIGEYLVSQIQGEYPEVCVDLELRAGWEGKTLVNHHEERMHFARTFFRIGVTVNRTTSEDILEIYAERSWGNKDINLEDLLQEIKRKLDFSKSLVKMRGGRYPVIFTPGGSLVLLYPLLYGLNGKNVVLGKSFLQDKWGKVLFSSLFSLLETSHEPWTLGTCPFDDEGIMTQAEKFLVENGRLEEGFFDLWSGSQAKRSSRGNGFRPSYRHLPEPTFATLKMRSGLRDRETLLEELEEGLVVDSVLGLGQSNVASGIFSCSVQLGFYVKDGEIQGRVKDVMLSGNAYQALRDIKEISRDTRWVHGRMLLPYVLVEPLQIEA